jgi:hypothetical protein
LTDIARSLLHLHAAYILSWCVQLGYVMYLVAGFIRVKREKEELKE